MTPDSDSDGEEINFSDLFGSPEEVGIEKLQKQIQERVERRQNHLTKEEPIQLFDDDLSLSPITEEELKYFLEMDNFGTPVEGEDRLIEKYQIYQQQKRLDALPRNVVKEIIEKRQRDAKNLEIEIRSQQLALQRSKKIKEQFDLYLMSFPEEIRMVKSAFNELDKGDRTHDSLKKIVSVNQHVDKWSQLFMNHYYVLYDFMIKYAPEQESNVGLDFFKSFDPSKPEDFIMMVHFVAYELKHPGIVDSGSSLQSIYRDWRAFEAKLKLRDPFFPTNVKGYTLPQPIVKQDQPLPLLEIITPSEETIQSITLEIQEFVSQHTEESWKFIDHFLAHWFDFRKEQYSAFELTIAMKQMQLLFSWVLHFDQLVLVGRKLKKYMTQHPVPLPEEEQKEVPLHHSLLITSSYYPKLPRHTRLDQLEKYLVLAKRPFQRDPYGIIHYFSFNVVTATSAISLKEFMMNVIHGLADKLILESRLRKKVSEEELKTLFENQLSDVLSGGLDKVYEFIKDHEDIKYVIALSLSRIQKESKKPVVDVKPSVIDKRSYRKRMVQKQVEYEPLDNTDETCSLLCKDVLVRFATNEKPDQRFVYDASPLMDDNGYLYYEPTPQLKSELCARDSRLKPKQDGIWINEGSLQFILGRNNKGVVDEFTQLDYESFHPLDNLSGDTPFSRVRTNPMYLERIYHTLNEIVPHFESFYGIIIKYHHLKLNQVLQFCYLLIVWNQPTFQLYHQDLIKLVHKRATPESISTIVRNQPDHDVISSFFKVVFHMKHDSVCGPHTGIDVLRYTTNFIFQTIQQTFPFLQMVPPYPVLPIYDFSKDLLRLSETSLFIEHYPDPETEVVVEKVLSEKRFQGTHEKRVICSCGSNEGVISTVQFRNGIPMIMLICDDCRPHFMTSIN